MASLALASVAPRAAMDLGISPALIGYQLGIFFCGNMLSAPASSRQGVAA
jgi:hypothetical protein